MEVRGQMKQESNLELAPTDDLRKEDNEGIISLILSFLSTIQLKWTRAVSNSGPFATQAPCRNLQAVHLTYEILERKSKTDARRH